MEALEGTSEDSERPVPNPSDLVVAAAEEGSLNLKGIVT